MYFTQVFMFSPASLEIYLFLIEHHHIYYICRFTTIFVKVNQAIFSRSNFATSFSSLDPAFLLVVESTVTQVENSNP